MLAGIDGCRRPVRPHALFLSPLSAGQSVLDYLQSELDAA
jgi:hypothetical protein